MNRTKKMAAFALAACTALTMFSFSAAAAESTEYPVEIHTMTPAERTSFETQTEYTPIIGSAYLPKNNEGGTNGSICASFTADKTSMAVVVTSAPGASNYNVQLYAGVPGEGERVSNYATVNVNNGVYFTGLTLGEAYYLTLSSNTLSTNSCTAVYSMFTY